MYSRTMNSVVILMMAVVFCGVGLKGCEKKALSAEATTKVNMSKPGTMPSGMQGMMQGGGMMKKGDGR